MNVKKIIAGILSCTTAFSMSVFYNSQPTFSADSYYIVGDESTTNESLDNVIEVADLTISTETTTTEIQTTEPIETTVVEETTITSIAETTTTETTTTYIVGDADENGKLNVRDAAFIAKALARKEADTLPESADFNIDDKIDVRDAAAIARHLASRYSDEEEPVVTSVSNDISVGVTTSTHIAHYRPTESCTCVVDEDTELCPLCGIPMDCTCGLDVTTTSNEGETTTTTAVGNDDTTTTQTAETINTLPVETTVATTNTTTTTATESTTTTTTTAVTTVTETVSSTTTAHIHNYVTETEIVEHEAEYQTKTVWMDRPMLYFNEYYKSIYGEGDDSNCFSHDPNEYFTDYDLYCYVMGSWDAFVNEYKDDFIIYMDKTNFEEYGLTEDQWYDVEYMQTKYSYSFENYGKTWSSHLDYYSPYGDKHPTFNPELDTIVCVGSDVRNEVLEDTGLINFDALYFGSHCIWDTGFTPVAYNESALAKEAWTENVIHEVCSCGAIENTTWLKHLTFEKIDEDENGTYDYVKVVDCDESIESVVIPSHFQGVPVTTIDVYAFENCSNLKSVMLPETITTIVSRSFIGCSSLISIDLPESVTHLNPRAFENSGLKELVVPKNVTSFNFTKFFGSASLVDIIFKNPNCEIKPDALTILKLNQNQYPFTGTIHGYENSTAQTFAEEYGYDFEIIK